MPRRSRGNHQSVAVSPLDMLEEEVGSFETLLDTLATYMEYLGTPDDGQPLRQKIMELKQALAVAESSISNRIKMEVQDNEIERLSLLEDNFFELKTIYFAILRQCVASENIKIEEPQPQVQNYSNNGPNIQRYGNPHATPALQTMQNGPAPIPERPSSEPYNHNDSLPSQSPNFSPQDNFNSSMINTQRPFSSPSSSDQIQQQSLETGNIAINGIELQQRDSIFWNAKELVERNEEMQFISSEMNHMQEAFQDLAVEVDVQGEREEEIEEHVEQANENAKEGVQTLGKSAKNSKRILLPGVGGGLGGVAGGVVGGVLGTVAGGSLTIPGAVAGAAIGATAGATVGHSVGKVIRTVNDKDMAKARLNEKWQPDSSTKNCTGCQKKFTQIKRRHHCRNCGSIFCGKCTKHRMYIPGVATESRPRVCRKCFEALMYHQQGIKPPSHNNNNETTQQSTLPPIPPKNSLPPLPPKQ